MLTAPEYSLNLGEATAFAEWEVEEHSSVRDIVNDLECEVGSENLVVNDVVRYEELKDAVDHANDTDDDQLLRKDLDEGLLTETWELGGTKHLNVVDLCRCWGPS